MALDLPEIVYRVKNMCRGTWDASTSDCADVDSSYEEQLLTEAVEIAGAPLNVYPLLGIHNQGGMIDLTGSGRPLTTPTSTYPSYLFDNDPSTSWISETSSTDVLLKPTFIGYDFGTKKNKNGTEKYGGTPAPIRYHIRTINIQQSKVPLNRVYQLRVEASDDARVWKRIDIINIPSSDEIVSVGIRQSAMYRYWRFIPTMFAGAGYDDTHWEVYSLQLLSDTQSSLIEVQDLLYQENRDRDYSKISYRIKCYYDPQTSSTDLSKFGIQLQESYEFAIPWNRMIEILGRPIVVGDLIELPTEVQYNYALKGYRKWLQVSDTTWSSEGRTMNWQPTVFRVTASPLTAASIETRDLFGLPTDTTKIGDPDFLSDLKQFSSMPYMVSEDIAQQALDAVPETGQDASGIAEGASMLGGTYDGTDLYVEDGLPPNDLPFTEGPVWPDNPSDGDYHRMTYDYDIPTRLYKYSSKKKDWVYQETDRRMAYVSHKPTADKLIRRGVPIGGDI